MAGPPPSADLDSAPLWAALREHRIALQRCHACDRRWWPRTPACPYCGSGDTGELATTGSGTVYSYIVANRALSDAMRDESHYAIVTVDLDDGARVFGRIDGSPAIGERVTAVFVDHDTWTELRFARAGAGSKA